MTVYLLTINHDHGADHWVCSTQELAEANLDAYVQDWWDQELPDDPMPDTPEARIAEYFEAVDDEDYDIDELPVLVPAVELPEATL